MMSFAVPGSRVSQLTLFPGARPRPAVRMLEGAPLDFEELQALSGTWSAHLDLEDDEGLGVTDADGVRCLTLHLEVRALELGGGHRTPLHTTDDTVGTALNLAWEATEVGSSPDVRRQPTASSRVEVRMVMGSWVLEGTGERVGLRCGALRGRVLRGADEDFMGNFELLPSLPAVAEAELPALEEDWLRRLDTRPAPPPRYPLAGFGGRWRCLLALDGLPPAIFTLQLRVAKVSTMRVGKFRSEGGTKLIAGGWGVYDAYLRSVSGRASKTDTAPKLAGTHLWLRVDRDQSTATLAGIGGLPVRESFSMWGQPMLDTMEAELASRVALAASAPAAPVAMVQRVDGFAYFGATSDLEHAVAGRFSLNRAEGEEGEEEGDTEDWGL